MKQPRRHPLQQEMVERLSLRTGYTEERIWQVFQSLAILIEADLKADVPWTIPIPCVGYIKVTKTKPRTVAGVLRGPRRKLNLQLSSQLRELLQSPIPNE